MQSKEVNISLNKANIKAALSMANMMKANGTFYEDHPIYELLMEIYNKLRERKKK